MQPRLMMRALAFLLVPGLASCALDAAEREYIAALRGEEEGMTREEQIAHIDRAIAIAPRRAHYWETRAIYRIDQRDFATAAADIDSAIARQDRAYLRFLRGLVACQSGHPGRALADFDRAIALQPENTQFYRGRALARVAVGDASGGLADAETMVVQAPQQAESYYARGVAIAALGRDRAAIAEFDEAMRRRPELVYPLEARADAYDRLGDRARAAADRAEIARREREEMRCAACLDPYRY